MSAATDSSAAARQNPSARRLDGRRIVVTGAAAGIGRAVACLFAREGASLALFDRDADGLGITAAETGSTAFPLDITNEDSVASAVQEAASALGGIDGLVNCAGVMHRGMMADVPVERWRRVLDINLTGTYVVSRACLPLLQQGTGSTIVNMARYRACFRTHRVTPRTPHRGAESSRSLGHSPPSWRPKCGSTASAPAWSTPPWPTGTARTPCTTP